MPELKKEIYQPPFGQLVDQPRKICSTPNEQEKLHITDKSPIGWWPLRHITVLHPTMSHPNEFVKPQIKQQTNAKYLGRFGLWRRDRLEIRNSGFQRIELLLHLRRSKQEEHASIFMTKRRSEKNFDKSSKNHTYLSRKGIAIDPEVPPHQLGNRSTSHCKP